MATERIESLISKEAIADFDLLSAKLDASVVSMEKLISKGIEYNRSFTRSSTPKQFNDGLKEMTENEKQLSLQARQTEVAQAKLLATLSRNAEILAEAKVANQEVNKQLRDQAREALGLVTAYDKLSKEYDEAAKRAKDLIILQGVNNKETQEAIRIAQQLDAKLKEADAQVGRFNRSVGNYASGFNGLSTSFAQITRELPSFTYSVQTGFLALSNNLPIFFDSIAKAKNEIKALREQGQQTQGLLTRLAGAFFSFQTVLSIGITLLTVYGKEIGDFFVALFKGRDSMNAFIQTQKLINTALSEGNGSYQTAVKTVNELRINIDLAKKGLLDKKEVVDQYNESIGKTTGEVKNLDEAERELTRNGEAYIKMMLFKAAANLALEEAAKKAFEAEQKRRKELDEFRNPLVDNVSTSTGGGAGVLGGGIRIPTPNEIAAEEQRIKQAQEKRKAAAIAASEREQKTFEDIARKFQADAASISSKFQFNFFGDDKNNSKSAEIRSVTKKFFDDLLQDEVEGYKKLSEIDTLYINSRINARNRAAVLEKDILEQQRANEIQNEKNKLNDILKANKDNKNSAAVINAQREFNQSKADIDEEFRIKNIQLEQSLQNDLLDIRQSSIAKQRDLDKKAHEETLRALVSAEKKADGKRLKAIDQSNEDRLNFLAADRDRQLAIVEDKYAKGKISEKRYNKERLAIEVEYNVLILKAQLDYAKQLLQIRKATGQNILAEEAKIKDIELKLAKATSAKIKKQTDEDSAELIKKVELYRDVANSLADLFAGIAGAGADREKNRIQDQIDLLEQKKQKEIEAANQSIFNEQDKAAAIAVIEARSAAQRDALERRQRQVEQQRARFEKAAGIARIIINTASAVTAFLARGSVPEAIAAGIIGAAQLAVAVATPIPRYAHGTSDHPGGPAIVGDAGKSELVVTPSGDMIRTPAVSTVMNLPRHSIVLPDMRKVLESGILASWRGGSQQPSVHQDVGAKAITAILNNKLEKLNNTIRNKKEFHSRVTHKALEQLERHVDSWIRYIDDQIQFRR